MVEETYIGTFTGGAAASVSPPVANSVAMRAAYAQCDAPTKAYLGGDWHSALLLLELTVPHATAWGNGARWFRCELSAIPSIDYVEVQGSRASFKGILAEQSPLSARCVDWINGKNDTVENIVPASCSGAHSGEYVGAYIAPTGPFPTTKKGDAIAVDGCEAMVAHFVGFSSWQRFDNPDIGSFESGFTRSQWNMGDRSVRCYAAAFTKDRKFIGSMKGIKSRKPRG